MSARSLLILLLILSACGAKDTARAIPASPAPASDHIIFSEKDVMRYGRSGSLKARPGKRDAVVQILMRDVEALKDAGCALYIISVSDDEPELIRVYEVWESAEAHRASLQLPSVRQAISEAMPMLTGEFEGMEFSVVGGLGLGDEPQSQG